MNICLKDREDLIIIPRDAEAICSTLLDLNRKPEILYRLAAQGQRTFQTVFGLKSQLSPRLRMLEKCMRGSTVARLSGLVIASVRRLAHRPNWLAGRELELTHQELETIRLQPSETSDLPPGSLTKDSLGRHCLH